MYTSPVDYVTFLTHPASQNTAKLSSTIYLGATVFGQVVCIIYYILYANAFRSIKQLQLGKSTWMN